MQRFGSERHREQPGNRQRRPAERQSVLTSRHFGPGEDDHVEDLREDQGRDREIDVAQAGGEIGDEGRDPGGADQPEQQRQPQVGRTGPQQGGCRAVDAEAEERRVPERHHAGVADQEIGRHRQQAPDQDLGQEPPPEFRQHQRRGDQQRQHDGERDPVPGNAARAHLGVGTKRPVGLKSKVRISTTNETMTAWAGLTQIEA